MQVQHQQENTAEPEGLCQPSTINKAAPCDAASTTVWTIRRSASPSACMGLQLSRKPALNM